MANAQEFVNNAIKAKKLVVFSKTTCPYCTKAKQCLSQYVPNTVSANDYEVIEINNRSDCSEIQSYFQQLTGATTVNYLCLFVNSLVGRNSSKVLMCIPSYTSCRLRST